MQATDSTLFPTSRNITLQELVQTLNKQHHQKYDVVVPSKFLSSQDGKLILNESPNGVSTINDVLAGMGISSIDEERTAKSFLYSEHFISTMCEKIKLPRVYFEHLSRSLYGDMIDYNVSELFNRAEGNFLLRSFVNPDTGEGIARALLSDKFKVIDNLDVLYACMKAIKDTGVNVKIESCDITETKLHARFYCPDIIQQAPELLSNYRSPRRGLNDDSDFGIYAGFTIQNSEVGTSSFQIAPRLVVGACRNGMVFKRDASKWKHLGSRMDEGIVKVQQDTKAKEHELIMLQARDAVATFCSPDYLGSKIESISSNNHSITKPQQAIDHVIKHYELPKTITDDLMTYFTKGGDVTRFGISQAMTAIAYEYPNADTAHEIEVASVKLMTSSLAI